MPVQNRFEAVWKNALYGITRMPWPASSACKIPLNKYLSVVMLILLSAALSPLAAQDKSTPRETARTFMQEGDYNNAVLVLNRAVAGNPADHELKKDLAFVYYLQRDFTRGIATIKPLTESRDSDIQSFQILGMIYKAIEETKEGEKLFKAGLKKFPEAGVLYNDYGDLLWNKKSYTEAIKQWQKGIQSDPNYSGNYYNAAKYYYMTSDKVWGLLYGEIFLNLESYSKRTPEIKTLLLEGYKKLFAEADLQKGQDDKNEFVKAFLEIMKNQSQVVSAGVTPDALSALRARFTLQWFDKYGSRFPFRLFDHYKQLAKEGMFDAYNQWIFGAANDLSEFQRWTDNHKEEYERFIHFQKSRVFKLPPAQYYQTK